MTGSVIAFHDSARSTAVEAADLCRYIGEIVAGKWLGLAAVIDAAAFRIDKRRYRGVVDKIPACLIINEALMLLFNRLVYLRRFRLIRELLSLYCVEIPPQVIVGNQFQLMHRGFCTVVHPNTVIGDRVKIFHQVTIGRADAHIPFKQSLMKKIVIEDDVVIFPGAKILGGAGITRIGRGSIVAANAVLTKSTGEFEIWGGIPARRIAYREKFIMETDENTFT